MPNNEPKMYTEEEVKHQVAREVAKQRMGDLEKKVYEVEGGFTKWLTKMDSSIDVIKDMINNHNDNVNKCRQELKDEIEEDFVTKPVFDAEMKRLESKIGELWVRISMAVGAVVVLINIGLHFIDN